MPSPSNARRCRRRNRKEVANIEQDLEHQLVAHIGVVEIGHPLLVGAFLGAIEGLAVDAFEVLEDAFAGAHLVRVQGSAFRVQGT